MAPMFLEPSCGTEQPRIYHFESFQACNTSALDNVHSLQGCRQRAVSSCQFMVSGQWLSSPTAILPTNLDASRDFQHQSRPSKSMIQLAQLGKGTLPSSFRQQVWMLDSWMSMAKLAPSHDLTCTFWLAYTTTVCLFLKIDSTPELRKSPAVWMVSTSPSQFCHNTFIHPDYE